MHISFFFLFGFITFGYIYVSIRKLIGKHYERKAWAETEKIHQKGIEYAEKKYLK